MQVSSEKVAKEIMQRKQEYRQSGSRDSSRSMI